MANTHFFKRIVFFVFAIFVHSNLQAGDNNALILPKANQSVTLDFVTVDELNVAFGERGHILTSTELGVWSQAKVPTKSTLTRGFFINPSTGWAVGHEATILHTIDGGNRWEIQHNWSHIDRPLLDIIFVTAEHGIAVGAYGLFLETHDGGNNWHQRFLTELLDPADVEYLQEIKDEDEEYYVEELNSMMPHFNAITRFGDRLLLVGEMGLVASSEDQGKTWSRLDADYQGSFFAVTVVDDNAFIVGGLRGKVLMNLDGTWSDYSFDQPITINNLVKVKNDIWALGNGGHYFVLSPDSGEYKHFQLERSPALLDIFFDENTPVMASTDGILIKPQLKADK